MSGARIATIMVKELRQISRDPATLGMLLAVPLFLLLMFGFAVTLDTKHIPLALLDHDRRRRAGPSSSHSCTRSIST